MRKLDPVEVVATAIPVLIEAVAVAFMIGAACLLVAIYATGTPS